MEKQVVVIFLRSEESTEVGAFEIGDERPLPYETAKLFRDRGLCKFKTSKANKEDKS